jgi:hypothetical protein
MKHIFFKISVLFHLLPQTQQFIVNRNSLVHASGVWEVQDQGAASGESLLLCHCKVEGQRGRAEAQKGLKSLFRKEPTSAIKTSLF